MTVAGPGKSEKLRDRFYIIRILFFLLGLTNTLPFCVFNTATDIWMYKFRDVESNTTDSTERTQLQADFNASFSMVIYISEMTFSILSFLLVKFMKGKRDLVVLLSVLLVLYSIIVAFVKIDTDTWQEGYFILVIGIIFIINSLNTVNVVIANSIVSAFPQVYLGSYIMGEGLARMFAASFGIFTLAVGMTLENSALLYFSLPLMAIVACLTMLYAIRKNDFFLYYMADFQLGSDTFNIKYRLSLLKQMWPSCIMVGTYILTMIASPTNIVVSEGEGSGVWADTYFEPTMTFLLLGIGDFVGRIIAFKIPFNFSGPVWGIICFVRMFFFVPFFMFCNAQPRHHLPVVFPHDYQYVIAMIVMSTTGGILTGSASYTIKRNCKPEDVQGALQTYNLMSGIESAIFSFLSLVLVDVL